MKYNYIFSLLISSFILISCKEEPIKIACIGDSITEGYGLQVPNQTAYPVLLDDLLGPDYSVLNLGRSGATVSRTGSFPYWINKEFAYVFEVEPDIIIIKLGTNDSKPRNWDPDAVLSSYTAMIDTFNTIATQPDIYLCLPVPVHVDRWGINDSTLIHGIIPAVKQIAEEYGLPLIDLYEPLKDYPQYFPDGVHPNEEGMVIMAEVIEKKIRGMQ